MRVRRTNPMCLLRTPQRKFPKVSDTMQKGPKELAPARNPPFSFSQSTRWPSFTFGVISLALIQGKTKGQQLKGKIVS